MAYNYMNNNYAGKASKRNNTSRNIPKDKFESMEFNLNKDPKMLRKYKKHEHDMSKEYKWGFTPPPR